MTAVLVVAAIAVVGAVVARVTWRRPVDERHSIQSHQQTLDTLRAMADRRPPGLRDAPDRSRSSAGTGAPARPTRPRPGPAHAGPHPGSSRQGQARPGSVRAPAPTPSSNGHDELVFVDDAAPPPRPDQSARSSALALSRGLSRGLSRTGRGHRRNRSALGLAGNRILPVVVAVVVLGVVVGAALALSPSHHPPTATHHRSGATHPSSVHKSHPQTTLAAPPQVRPTTSTSATASYGTPSTTYSVGLQATGPCWVEATEASTGRVVWTGTLASGQTQAIPATGNLLVRLGAANDVSITLNGEQVILPTGFHSPFDMTFVPA
ncbi:MAG TPA: RodZ domain-containing protein [Acidimicrobiales bacterium]|nr:RodZ domain-containing protein [Acidimicrobiales bacterium]